MKTIDSRISAGKAGQAAIDALGDLGGFDSDQRDGNGYGFGVKAGRHVNRSEWAAKAANILGRAAHAHGVKAITTGSIDVANVIAPGVVALPESPERLIDVLINRTALEGNAYSYLRQTVRTNNAAPVADLGTKPTSVFTFAEVEDRARVIAHLSEPIPERFFEDQVGLTQVLGAEMFRGVLDALEAEVINGSGVGEHFTGIWNTVGVTTQAFSTDLWTTARKARTTLRNRGEVPTAWVLNPADIEKIDLEQDVDGHWYAANEIDHIFGAIPRLVSASIPVGFALLGDFAQTQVFVRENLRLDADKSGALFDTNAIKLRGEGRFGFGVLRPQALLKVDIAA